MGQLVSDQVWCYSLLLFGLLLACLAKATEWSGEPPLKNRYKEHEFLAACREGNLPAVRYYLDHGGVMVDQCFISGITGYPTTGIIPATVNDHREVVKFLIHQGASPNSRVADGGTPLLYAAKFGHKEVLETLLDANADPNPQHSHEWTPLFSAAKRGFSELVNILLATGIDPNQQLSDGSTPLHVAAERGHIAVVRILLQNGALLNSRATNGCTSLFYAAQNGHREVVDHLAAVGADPTATWWCGMWPGKSARTAAAHNRPLFRRSNPERYDNYTGIMATLKQAERGWQRTHRIASQSTGSRNPAAQLYQLSQHSQYPGQTVSERTPLLAMERLSVSGK